MKIKQIAEIILKVQKMREESWDHEKEDQRFAEYGLSFTKCFIVACETAEPPVEKDLWYLLDLANHWYNDLQAWAEQVAQGKPFDDLLMKPEDIEAEAKARGEIKVGDDSDKTD